MSSPSPIYFACNNAVQHTNINGLLKEKLISLCSQSFQSRHITAQMPTAHTFPPSTSSPMIRHAAVLIVRFPATDIFKVKTAGRMRDWVMKEGDATVGKRYLAA
jgi:hypothetical protein